MLAAMRRLSACLLVARTVAQEGEKPEVEQVKAKRGLAQESVPCTEGDFRLSFSACSPGGFRNVYPYVDREFILGSASLVCDPYHEESEPLPAALIGATCAHSCEAGSYLTAEIDGTSDGSIIQTKCQACPSGRFSLGGGDLVSGAAADWVKPWPVQMTTSCQYMLWTGQWLVQDAALGSGCTVRVDSPKSVAGGYAASITTFDGSDIPPHFRGLLRMTRRTSGTCESFVLTSFPPISKDVRDNDVIMIINQDDCTLREHALAAQKSGAVAVVVIADAFDSRLEQVASHVVSSSGVAPGIPLVVIGRADGDVLKQVLIKNIILHFNHSQTACQTSATSGVNSNPNRHCSTWQADPSGRYVHSGFNSDFSNIQSGLSWTVNLVRDGYVSFRYAVDAEEGFDGFTMTVDWMEVVPFVSTQHDYTEFKIDLKKGPHILEWFYLKDEYNSEGLDGARIEMIEVVGTHYTDLDCRPCSGSGHSVVGSARCNNCDGGSYLSVEGSNSSCVLCPPGKWAPAGSVSEEACLARQPCGLEDIETIFTSCSNNVRNKTTLWRQPMACDPSLKSSVIGVNGVVKVPCAPCQPNMWRPTGGACVPQFVKCPQGQRGVQELVFNRWESFPKNFSKEVLALQQPSSDELLQSRTAVGGSLGWRLVREGWFAYVGDDSVGNVTWDGDTESVSTGAVLRSGDAVLHLRVNITVPLGSVEFVVQTFSSTWGREGYFMVDNARRNLPQFEAVGGASNMFRVGGPLNEGVHLLSWVYQYTERSKTGIGGSGLRLLSVNVTGAAGAGASRCELCELGRFVTSDGLHCESCPAGTFMDGGSLERDCLQCQTGRFASFRGASACEFCGVNTVARAPGLTSCSPLDDLVVFSMKDSFDTYSEDKVVTFDVRSVRESWLRATNGTNGPFEVRGRRFYLDPFNVLPAPPLPGQDLSASAALVGHIWELPANNAKCSSGLNVVPPAVRWGIHPMGVEGVANGKQRAVKVFYSGANSTCLDGNGGVAFLFYCKGDSTFEPLVRVDNNGFYHLPNLQVLNSSGLPGNACASLVLQWPTSAACPPCEATDYALRSAICLPKGTREGSYIKVRPCLGGVPSPAPFEEPCGVNPSTAKEAAQHASITSYLAIALALVMTVFLCAYACYLRIKFRRYDQQSL